MSLKPCGRSHNIIVQELKDEALVYDLENGKAYCLNRTSALIWYECDGKTPVADIGKKAGKKLGSAVSDDIVWLAIDQFKQDNLLENSAEITTPVSGLSRRDVVKRIGFASMVALPVISSVIAPSALQAQSTACFCGSAAPNSRPPGCSCTLDTECCSGVCFLSATCQNVAPAGGAAGCCPGAANCGAFPLAPGCLCLNNSECASGSCVSSACQIAT